MWLRSMTSLAGSKFAISSNAFWGGIRNRELGEDIRSSTAGNVLGAGAADEVDFAAAAVHVDF